jgi:hypothetical protein
VRFINRKDGNAKRGSRTLEMLGKYNPIAARDGHKRRLASDFYQKAVPTFLAALRGATDTGNIKEQLFWRFPLETRTHTCGILLPAHAS